MTVWQIYPTPESGWVRYDDIHPDISYSSGWVHTNVSGALQNTYRLNNRPNETIKFNFTGTSIRLISGTNGNLSSNIGISIDGKSYPPYSIYNPSLVWNRCVFEATGLSDREHTVVITALDNVYSVFDGIDLIQGNTIKPYREIVFKNTLIYHNGEYKKWIPYIPATDAGEYPKKALTSKTSDPSFIVSASSEWGGTYTVVGAFTKTNTGGTDRFPTASGQLSGWVKVRLDKEIVFNKYVVEATGRSGELLATIKDWTLQGSNDDVNWDILDTQSQTNWTLGEARTFNIPNNKAYSFYKLEFTSNNGYGSNSQIGELRFFEKGTDEITAHWEVVDLDFEGMDLSEIPKEAIDELVGNFEIVTKLEEDKTPKVYFTGQSKSVNPYVYPSRNISLIGIEQIDSLTVDGVGNGKISVSTNSGQSWLVYKDDSWITVDDISKGMRIDEVNALTTEQLGLLITDSKTLQISYYLTSDTVINSVQLKASLQGIERLASRNEYEVEYDQSTKTITYNILVDGSYTITWVDGKQ